MTMLVSRSARNPRLAAIAMIPYQRNRRSAA